MKSSVAFERRDRVLGGIDGDRARLAGERRRQQIGMVEHGLALGEVSYRPPAASPAA